jgi:pimeloyl-ACP methyl ester carboxylesterase
MSCFVLIHGGWHGGWCWKRVAQLLRSRGHDVFTPSLTGMGDREHLCTPEVGLDTHTADILSLIRVERLSDVILVGHSYGGVIMTLVADQIPSCVSALVYVDAVIPESGVPGWVGFPSERREQMLNGAQTLGGWRVPPPDPSIWGINNEADLRWLRQCCSPHPIKTMRDAPQLTGTWQSIRTKHYILAGAQPNPRFVTHHHAVSKQADWSTETIMGGHDLMITHSVELADSLGQIAQRVAANSS